MAIFVALLRGFSFRTPGLPGRGGLENPDIYCYICRNSIVEHRQTGEWGLKSQFTPDALKAKKKFCGSTNGTTVSGVGRSGFLFFRNHIESNF